MRRDHSLNSPLLSMLAVLAGCVLYLAVPVEAVGQSQAAATSAGDGLALTEARKKVKDIGWEIERAESELRQLSPPVRITDSKGTTFNADKQRQYESNRARIDRKIRDLRAERTAWELRVNQLALAQDMLNRSAAAADRQQLAPPPPAPVVAPASAALTEARDRVKDISWEIEQRESALRQLSPPTRTSDSKGTTFDEDKQRQYNNDRARIDRELRHLKEERTIWELRVSQLVSMGDERNRATR